ncbi:uncharacterized protein [Branchiostoma lanceolatum]|uniref:uncharacterized protein n=1 Tax=Branchiostoma lanceolatum TaxID=7740 RepID=UPI003453F688
MKVVGVIVLGCVALLFSSSSAVDSDQKQAEVVDKLEKSILQILLEVGDKEQKDRSEEGDVNYSACDWYGTAPFCDGSCPNVRKAAVEWSKCGDGRCCWTGQKVKCCATWESGGPL